MLQDWEGKKESQQLKKNEIPKPDNNDLKEKINFCENNELKALNGSQENFRSNRKNEISSADKETKESSTSSEIDHFSKEANQYSLINSVKKAANAYNTITQRENISHEKPFETGMQETSTRKAKSIAEKLGFINFDEEELDTPTFLRKDEEKEANLKSENNIKPMEL